ncbi:hypothetical protein IAU60_001086 [Kwoniella sp. DSM 27419]
MSQRQGRRSLGPAAATSTEVADAGPTEQQKFDDFRRKHSKQNKEIIMENIHRKAMIKSLQDDLRLVHMELSEVRQANVLLQARVKRMQTEAGKLGDGRVRDALDQLITALPALRHLRDSLTVVQRAVDVRPISRAPPLQAVENTYATRPAASARQIHGLGDLAEGSECDSEKEAMIEIRRERRRSRGRSSEAASVAASRSPRRNVPAYVEVPDTPLSPISPAKSLSPSPKKHIASGPRKHRRRRESGLLTLTVGSPSPTKATSLIQVKRDEDDVGETSEWEEGGAVLDIVPVEVESATGVVENIAMPTDIIVVDSKSANTMEAIAEVTSSESSGSSRQSHTALSSPTATSAMGDHGIDDDGTGRRRRARSSVNYKEPSLNKKMRKPDGLTAEEAFNPVLRKSPRKSPQKSASPPPSAPVLFTSTKVIVPRNTGMRRKSMLPKAGPKAVQEQHSDQEDEDDVDDLIEYHADLRSVEERTALLELGSPVKKPAVAASGVGGAGGSHSVPTSSVVPVQAIKATTLDHPSKSVTSTLTTTAATRSKPGPRASSFRPISSATPASLQPADRPRTAAGAGLGLGRPSSVSTARSVSAGSIGEKGKEKPRDVLAEVEGGNLDRRPVAPIKEVLPKPRAVSARTRRSSSII